MLFTAEKEDVYKRQVIGVMKNYNHICETEKKIEEKINTLQNDKNIDFEIFSPRMEEKSIREMCIRDRSTSYPQNVDNFDIVVNN